MLFVVLAVAMFAVSIYSVTATLTVTVASPAAGGYLTSATVNLNYTVTGDNLDQCWFVNGTGAVNALPTCANTTFNAPANTGTNVTVFANDTGATIYNSSLVSFIVDTITPTSVILTGQ